MGYEIEYKPAADRQLEKLAKSAQKRIIKRIEELAENPRPRGAKKLEGMDDLWRIRVGQYRVLYTIEDDVLMVLVVRVADRKDVYR